MKINKFFISIIRQIIIYLAIALLTYLFLYTLVDFFLPDQKLLHLFFLPLLTGLTLEYKNISKSWKEVGWVALGSLFVSLLIVFFREENQYQSLEEKVENWPYIYTAVFIFLAIVIRTNEATRKMTEGVTLLLTLSINYWILANGYLNSSGLILKILIPLNFIFSAFSILNALLPLRLNKITLLLLSIWSSIITLILSIDNFLKLYKNRDIENMIDIFDQALIFSQFFLLGISGIYVAQNIMLLLGYFPSRKFIESISETTDLHLQRFSEEQVFIFDTLIVFFITSAGYAANYYYQFLPVNLMIWATITLTPLYLWAIHKFLG